MLEEFLVAFLDTDFSDDDNDDDDDDDESDGVVESCNTKLLTFCVRLFLRPLPRPVLLGTASSCRLFAGLAGRTASLKGNDDGHDGDDDDDNDDDDDDDNDYNHDDDDDDDVVGDDNDDDDADDDG
eukprot:6276518-Amphidinium_carterae.1